MYGNLTRKNLGDFKEEWYWCSTQMTNDYAFRQGFTKGEMDYQGKGHRHYVRPIRQVPGAE
jgi:hypothetical protein